MGEYGRTVRPSMELQLGITCKGEAVATRSFVFAARNELSICHEPHYLYLLLSRSAPLKELFQHHSMNHLTGLDLDNSAVFMLSEVCGIVYLVYLSDSLTSK